MLSVVEGAKDPSVEVEWDLMEDVSGYKYKEPQVIDQRLLPSLWHKDKQGGWRMDVDVEVDIFDEESDNETSSEGELEEEDVSESSDMEDSEQD